MAQSRKAKPDGFATMRYVSRAEQVIPQAQGQPEVHS